MRFHLITAASAVSIWSSPAGADSTMTMPGGGEWQDSTTWTNGAPGGADAATINSGDKVSVTKPGSGAGTIFNSGELEVHGAQPPDFLKVGFGVGNLVVGVSSLGQVRLDTGATISSSNVTLGYQLGTGYVAVDGAANGVGDRAVWSNAGEFIVGGSSAAAVDGIVMITNQGTIKSRNTSISNGTAKGTVSINNGTWTNTNLFAVGDGGPQGTLTIENHGVVNDLTGAIGAGPAPDQTGKAFVDNSTWNNIGEFYVGVTAHAELNVFNGGLVTNTNGYIANSESSVSSATISGGTWTNSGGLFVGFYGDGTLHINDGGTVTNSTAVIGRYGEAKGSVVVDNGTWTSTGEMSVGNGITGLPGSHAVGQMVVRNGGKVTCNFASIAVAGGSSGTVLVKGRNAADSPSTWTVGGELDVGDRGTGSLAISDGGVVTSPAIYVGIHSGNPAGAILEIAGTPGRRGVLETGFLFQGVGMISMNGGILRATADKPNFTVNVGSVEIGVNGGYVDTNGHNIGMDTAFGGTGGLIKQGAGIFEMRGLNNPLGSGSVVEAGKLLVNGSLTGNMQVNAGATLGGSGPITGSVTVLPGGIVSPGNSPGVLTVGSLILNPHAVLHMELGNVSDHLAVTGNFTRGGTLRITLGGGFVPSSGMNFTLWNAGSIGGGFSGYDLPALPVGLFWQTGEVNTTGVLRIGPIRESFTSFVSFAANYALPGLPTADDDGDGFANIVEYELGLNPQGPDFTNPGIPKLLKSGVLDEFSFKAPEVSPADVVMEIQSSSDMVTWPTLASRTGSGAWSGPSPPVVSTAVDGMQTITLTRPDGGNLQRFYRLSLRLQ